MFLKGGPTIHVSTIDLMNTCTQSYSHEHLQDTRLADLGTDKVTIADSLLTHRSPTNTIIYPVIYGINLAKKSHLLNLGFISKWIGLITKFLVR